MPRHGLRQQYNVEAFQPWLIFQQRVRQRGQQGVRRAWHPLQDFAHIRQAVIWQMAERTRAAVENALHVIEYRQDHLIVFTDLMETEAAGKVAEQHFVEGGLRHIIYPSGATASSPDYSIQSDALCPDRGRHGSAPPARCC